MEIIGKITQVFPETSGTSQAGKAWKKREYVLETQETYPRKIFFDFFGDRADLYPLQIGQEIRLTFEIDSREWQGPNGSRWFTSIRGLKAEPLTGAPQQPSPYQQPGYPQPGSYPPSANTFAPPAPPSNIAPAATSIPPAGPTDDLPF